jgi:hypothetical protein
MRILPALLLACLALAACGEDDEEAAVPSGGGSAFADLTVQVDRDGEGGKPAHTATIRCAAPEDSRACRALGALDPKVLEPTPGNVACTQQYGGPETATVKGTLRGEPVDAELSRVNGCEIARWQDASAFLDAAK